MAALEEDSDTSVENGATEGASVLRAWGHRLEAKVLSVGPSAENAEKAESANKFFEFYVLRFRV